MGNNPPGEIGSFSNNTENGVREVYAFECAPDDSKTTLYKLLPGVDVEIGRFRTINKNEFFPIKEMRRGDEPFEMNIKTDKSPEERKIRISHL
jgi:hypothetical protein